MLATLSKRGCCRVPAPRSRCRFGGSARPGNYYGAFDVSAGLRRSGDSGMRGEAGGGRPVVAPGTAGPSAVTRLRDYWLTPPGRVMLAATLLALAIRLYT